MTRDEELAARLARLEEIVANLERTLADFMAVVNETRAAMRVTQQADCKVIDQITDAAAARDRDAWPPGWRSRRWSYWHGRAAPNVTASASHQIRPQPRGIGATSPVTTVRSARTAVSDAVLGATVTSAAPSDRT